jgi:clathrin heavy chain
LVERQEPSLWAKVLDPSNTHRQNVIEQVVQTALPETKNVDEVSITVKAFIDADLPEHLIELLERIVLHNSDFAENASLQNLLILTAIKSYPTRVMDYINKLDQYDCNKLAEMAKSPEYGLFDEALCIYKKFNKPVEAIRVILYNLNNIK